MKSKQLKKEKECREKVNFTLPNATIKMVEKFLSEVPMNKSKLIEKLILNYIKENSI